MEADGGVILDVNLNVGDSEKELAKLKKKIETAEQALQKKKGETGGLEQSLKKAREDADQTLDRVLRLRKELESINQTLDVRSGTSDPNEYIAALDKQQQLTAELTEQEKILEKQDAAAEKLDGKYMAQLQTLEQARNVLNDQKAKAGELVQQIDAARVSTEAAADGQSGFASATDAASAAMDKLLKRIEGLVLRVMVFSVITKGLRALRALIEKYIQEDKKAQKAIAQLKAAFLTLAQPIVEVVIPALAKLISMLASGVAQIASFVNGLFGKSLSESAAAAKALNDEAEALDGVGASAKKAEKSMASFDEINQIGNEDSGGGGGGSAPDFSGLMQGTLDGLGALLTGLALVALGVLMIIVGGLAAPVGYAMVVAGAIAVWGAIASDDGALASSLVESGLSTLFQIIGPWIAVIGVILLVTGNIFLGLGLIVAGIALFEIGAAAEDGGKLGETIVERLKDALDTIGLLVAVIGVLLVVMGHIILGLGLFVAGLALFAYSQVADDGGMTIQEKIMAVLQRLTLILGAGLLALGAILCFTGNLPLGIGLIAAGVVSLAAAAVLNKDKIIAAIQGPLGIIMGIVSGAMLVLGVILCCTGNLPLGLALIAVGLVGLVSAVEPNANAILDMIKGVWDSITTWWNEKVVPAFKLVGKIFTDLVVNPLLAAVEGFINFFIKGLNWLIEKINSISFDVPDWVPGIGGKTFGFNLQKVSEIRLPRLAQGAVIPANHEFTAILGDQKRGVNIETPLATMVQAFKQALSETGGGSGTHTVILQLDRRELGRVVYEVNREETQRLGVNFAGVRAL